MRKAQTMTTAKRKTATKPAHVKPLTSARWSGVRLSKTTEKKLSDAYSKRRATKRRATKPATAKAKEEKIEPKFRFDKNDLDHIASTAKRWTRNDLIDARAEKEFEVFDKITTKTSRPGKNHGLIAYSVRGGPKGYMDIWYGDDAKPMGGRAAPSDECYFITRIQKGKGGMQTVDRGFIFLDPAELEIRCIAVLKRMVR